MKTLYFFILISILTISNSLAQDKKLMEECSKYLQSTYVSDGQEYKAYLNSGESAEFHTTFYSGNHYRVAGVSDQEDSQLIFSVYDQENNLLFTNKKYASTPYWDFEFASTLNCTIKAQYISKKKKPGSILLLIGFQQ
ncbi:hypothetical protein EO244_09965 [Ancylomarina salipaludis]|uniref:Uncharacterized protein n=1 Tax=Ancylomarina salipaludis TaxID=2501299 RepID=A0A4Q1JLS3_9BACT|nr:hypothetical protein [Ancylomarina salipaludis]RXQ93895.1 hypothetical protein EO244_09965 [Ancylomarina salipaludis]